MANRIYVSMQEDYEEPKWIENVVPFVEKVMKKQGFDHEEISIMFCKDEMIRQLNNFYRGIDSATDVLSFENDGEYTDEEGKWKNVGDIAISLETLPVNASYFEVDENTELKRLIIHGILHLNGMDHGEEHIEKGVKPVCNMLTIQEELLDEFSNEMIINI